MAPLVEKIEKELGIKIEKKETWHDAKNQEELSKVDEGKCGGVPFFINKTSKKFICGAASYEDLKKWAQGE